MIQLDSDNDKLRLLTVAPETIRDLDVDEPTSTNVHGGIWTKGPPIHTEGVGN